jgi:signal transduction histidine kinase
MTTTNAVDERRVLEIDRYRVLVEPPRADLLALVDVAAQVAQVPLATINLITDTEQHQIATTGFDASICAREDSMCNLALEEKAPIIVPDASQDPRYKDNPFVTGEIGDVRFYATHQLRTPDGVVIGTLCVFDEQPRELSDEQEEALVKLADRVVDLLELELRTRELTRAVEALERTQHELERSNEVLTAFAGQVAHDLRNPLAAVQMSLEMLEDQTGAADPSTLSYVVDRARSGAGRMQQLIEDLLSYARVGGQMARVPVDLGAVVADVRSDLAVVLEGAQVEVGTLPTVEGDPVQLRGVMKNLLVMSAKFTRAGEPARIEVRGGRLEDRWRVEVVDHGLGVPEADRERVFAPLARAHGHEDVEGQGIGLATVRRIIDAHHGRIGIAETPGGGATVWIELPG